MRPTIEVGQEEDRKQLKMIAKEKGREASYSFIPARSQTYRTCARARNTTGLAHAMQAGGTPHLPTAGSFAGCDVRVPHGQHRTAPPDVQLPAVIIGPVVGQFCLIRFRHSTDLDQLIRNVIEKPHRRWSRSDYAWRVRVNHLRFLEAALFQAGIRIVDIRRAAK